MPLAPGTILQHRYLSERLAAMAPGHFVEVGPGQGHLSRLLANRGWTGLGYELNPASVTATRRLLAAEIAGGRYDIEVRDWLDEAAPPAADMVVSSMVLEHLDDDDERRYFARAAESLNGSGVAILFVPASPRHWGIEDEIAGHFRRYTRATLTTLATNLGWHVRHAAGLTYPTSNLLKAVSDRLVARAEGKRMELSMQERTELSGNRSVAWKTTYPKAAGILLNPVAMRPAHVLQKRFTDHPDAMVLYAELTPPA